MDNQNYLFPNDCNQNQASLMEITPENSNYQSQSEIYYQSQPPEVIPIASSDFPSYQNYNTKHNNNNNMNVPTVTIKDKDYEKYQVTAQTNNYRIKQPTENSFHISTGDKWIPLLIFCIIIILILFVVSVATGYNNIQGDGEAALALIFSPCILIFLIGICLKQCCCTYYNADIIMADNSLIIKRRSCVCISSKIYLPGQINEILLYNYQSGKSTKYKLDIQLSNNERKNILVLNNDLTTEEINYFIKVVNDYIKFKMKN